MKAAIYARYSSENQRPQSIDDQISTCRQLAAKQGISIEDNHIYSDEAKSGANKDRIGLNSLIEAARNRLFQVVLVDDLSRLARDNFLMLTVLADLNFEGIRVISVADGLDSNDQDSALDIQIRGIFNELQLQDLKKKTMRGLVGQKQRGFSCGERTFGYKSIPVGEIRFDKKGKERPEGYKKEIDPRESEIVLRVFELYRDGNSINRIVQVLNQEGIPSRNNYSKSWSLATIGRMLDNENILESGFGINQKAVVILELAVAKSSINQNLSGLYKLMKIYELCHKTFGTMSERVGLKEKNSGLEEKENEALKTKREVWKNTFQKSCFLVQ